MTRLSAGQAVKRLTTLSAELRAMASEIEMMTEALAASPERESPAEELLDLRDLCARIHYAPQTIRNQINQGELKVGKHFVQRRRCGKILFIWPAIERWLRERDLDRSIVEPFIPSHHARTRKIR